MLRTKVANSAAAVVRPMQQADAADLGFAEPARMVAQFVELVAQLTDAANFNDTLEIVVRAARKLTSADAATIILREEEECFYAAEDSIRPLWPQLRIPAEECISRWVMSRCAPISIYDVNNDARISAEQYRATWVRSLAMAPIRTHPSMGAIGLYWSQPHHATQKQVRFLQALADASTNALDKCRMQQQLESLVEERTRDLENANRELRRDAVVRREMEAEIFHLSLTDDLTSLNNRRGFLLRADQLFKLVHRIHTHAWLVYVDIDGLKMVNDERGHEAGDRLICGAAKVLRESFRESDVIGRVGGDEFVIFATGSSTPLSEIHERLERNVEHFNDASPGDQPRLSFSIGSIDCDLNGSQTLEQLIHLADAAMYREKRSKRQPAPDQRSG